MAYANTVYTYNDIPIALSEIIERLKILEQKIDIITSEKTIGRDEWMNMDQLIEYLPAHPAKQTVYGWTQTRQIPFHKIGSKNAFLKSEIDAWLMEQEVKSTVALAKMAADTNDRNKIKNKAPWRQK